MSRFGFVVVFMMPLLSSNKANTTTSSHIGTSTSLPTAAESISSTSSSAHPLITLCNTSYTMHNDEERTCLAGLQCKYGICDKGAGFSCICDAGATGILCNDECCLDCGSHGNCFYDSFNDEELCNCDRGYKGEICGERISPTSTNPSTREVLPTSTNPSTEECSLQCPAGLSCLVGVSGQTCVLPTTISSLPSSNAPQITLCNTTYNMHTDEERTCISGLQCKYGICDKGAGLFSCICDKGSTGILCTQECCLDCGDHGNCLYDISNKRALCNCNSNYKGERCAEQIDHSLTTPSRCSLDCPPGHTCTNLALPGASACIPVGSSTPLPLSTGPSNQLCGESYQIRNLTERECPAGPLCKHGVCVVVDGSVNCECDDKAFGILCEYECCKECGDNGACFYDAMLEEEFCNCFSGFTGGNCSDVITTPAPISADEPTWYLWVVGACVGVLVFLIVLLVVIPYMLWRNRVILVMKIVHYFQGYEDDDEKEWDTFISYKSDPRDEEFVVNVLFPTLEREMGFKTHVHFRDFIPGDTIANNIIKAVQGSRRTILVITPNFVKSEFTKFEYQVAQQEMLKQKHRIIPILLDDISGVQEDLDPNLKVILGSVTYLEWPKEETEKKVAKFWKRLQLSLPKKRTTDDQTTGLDELKASRNSKMSYDLVHAGFGEEPHYIGNNVKDNTIILNIPECLDGEDLVYDKIDDIQLDKQREVNAKKDVEVNKYIEILDNTRL